MHKRSQASFNYLLLPLGHMSVVLALHSALYIMPIHSIVLGSGRRFNEFGADGGPAAKALQPKFNVFVKNISAHLGVAVPHIEVRICFFFPS
jgi:hypothetical protein